MFGKKKPVGEIRHIVPNPGKPVGERVLGEPYVAIKRSVYDQILQRAAGVYRPVAQTDFGTRYECSCLRENLHTVGRLLVDGAVPLLKRDHVTIFERIERTEFVPTQELHEYVRFVPAK
jgi:hypothetical protein